MTLPLDHTAVVPRPPIHGRLLRQVWPYVQIARVDHWFKNAFMLLGVVLAFSVRPGLFELQSLLLLVLALGCTCLVASSNYVINELLDARSDRFHPKKRLRPIPMGLTSTPVVVAEWLALGAVGIGGAFWINAPFGCAAALLWVMGCIYNLPPIRTKEVPYLDVLSESINNPIRLALGWFALIPDRMPPLSLMLAYWMVGGFFMATKRFAEYRRIGDPVRAARYRRSFQHYDANRLLISMMFYVTAGALFGGIFIVRYQIELILSVPVVAGFFAYYVRLSLQDDSVVQAPEKLYRDRGFFWFAFSTVIIFLVLLFVQIAPLYELFNIERAGIEPLWRVGG